MDDPSGGIISDADVWDLMVALNGEDGAGEEQQQRKDTDMIPGKESFLYDAFLASKTRFGEPDF